MGQFRRHLVGFRLRIRSSSRHRNPRTNRHCQSFLYHDIHYTIFKIFIITLIDAAGGGKTDSTQEMIAIGMGSIFSSFFGCLPQTASFARSSVLSASGGQTQLANLFNGPISCFIFC